MSITLNTVVYTEDSHLTPNKVQYTSPAHDFSAKDLLVLGRTAPKPSGSYRGNARAEVKRTKTLTLDDSTTADAIITLSASIPVGAADADVDAMLDDMGDFSVSTGAQNLVRKHDITQ